MVPHFFSYCFNTVLYSSYRGDSQRERSTSVVVSSIPLSHQKWREIRELNEAAIFGAVRAIRAQRNATIFGHFQVGDMGCLGAAVRRHHVRIAHAATFPGVPKEERITVCRGYFSGR